jgi:hypothetical protein
MSGTERPAYDLVRRSLDAVIASETFARSERLRSFLTYIVESDLAGKAAHLKGYSIGIDVFGRPPGFDAGNDPLVRVQAGKLRKLLDQYYETEGAADVLRIRVPLGSYVPDYTMQQAAAEPVAEVRAPAKRPPGRIERAKTERKTWRPAPVSSPLALLSLLPLLFLAPSVYPDPTDAAIARAQLVLSVQHDFADYSEALPRLRILQCWPAGGECNSLARAITDAADFHKTVRLLDGRQAHDQHPLSYTIRIENRSDGRGIYARLVHDTSGATVYTRHFTREQLRSPAGIAYEAVAFVARALAATGPLYRHAARSGTASRIMMCLARAERGAPRGTFDTGLGPACGVQPPETLAGLSSEAGEVETGLILTR